MAEIDNLGKIYYCPLKSNRLVDDSGRVEKYKRIDQLNWLDQELLQGKLVKINKFPKHKKVKLFWVTVSPSRTEYVVTNDLTQDYTPEVQAICSIRWKIEEFHRELHLQTSGIGKKLAVEFLHTPAYSPDFNLVEYEIHLLRLEKLHHLPSNVTIAEIENKLEDVKILMSSEQISKTLEHIYSLAPMSIA